MYWLSFLLLSLALYLPPLDPARRLWAWAERQYWYVPIIYWHWPAWLAYTFWLTVVYLALGTALYLAHRRWAGESHLGRGLLAVSRASLGGLGAVVWAVAALVVLLAWPILPACQVMYGWTAAISPPVAALAALYLLAEAVRMAEEHHWVDRAFAAWRREWLQEQGHHS